MSEDNDDKQFQASQKRLDDARARGEVVKSTDLNTAASYIGWVLACLIGGNAMVRHFGETAMALLDQPDRIAPLLFASASAPVLAISSALAKAVAPLLLLPMAFVLLSLFAQRALHFAPEKLMFKASRISPLSIAKQKFGREGLFEFAKSLAKLCVVALLLGFLLMARAPEIMATQGLAPNQGVGLMVELFVQLIMLVSAAVVVFGVVDYMWQSAQHQRRNMMSRQEVMDEAKDAEGDPHVKQQRRQRGQEIATNQMLQDVAKADVIVVNPTHYAVALKWSRKDRSAPVCVAKGVDEIAARIREKAAEAGVPIHSDPPTARAVFATVEVGQQIRPEHYRAVAAAIRFSEAMRKRKKARLK